MSWAAPLIEQERQAAIMRWTQGDSVSFAFRFRGFADHIAYTWSMQVREAQSRTAPLVATFTCTSAVDATVDLIVTATLAAADNQRADANLYWDLQSDDGAGGIRTWLGGTATITPEVTAAP
jgi:hypothetical protein